MSDASIQYPFPAVLVGSDPEDDVGRVPNPACQVITVSSRFHGAKQTRTLVGLPERQPTAVLLLSLGGLTSLTGVRSIVCCLEADLHGSRGATNRTAGRIVGRYGGMPARATLHGNNWVD